MVRETTAFESTDKQILKKISTTYVRPQVEQVSPTWSSHGNKQLRERARDTTRMEPELRRTSYEGRKVSLELPTLEDRRLTGDDDNPPPPLRSSS